MYAREHELDAKIKAVNAANKAAVEIYRLLEPIFRPLVGCKILKADGSLLKSVEKLIPELPDVGGNTYRSSSKYSLVWNVSACQCSAFDSIATYHDVSVYVGRLDGDVLTELYDAPEPKHYRTDHTPDEARALQAEYEAAKSKADDIRSKLALMGINER